MVEKISLNKDLTLYFKKIVENILIQKNKTSLIELIHSDSFFISLREIEEWFDESILDIKKGFLKMDHLHQLIFIIFVNSNTVIKNKIYQSIEQEYVIDISKNLISTNKNEIQIDTLLNIIKNNF